MRYLWFALALIAVVGGGLYAWYGTLHPCEMLKIDILRDERWDLPDADRGRVLSGLAYFTDPNDMIPDSIPGIGYLDDAIMVELIVRELRHDLEGYEDFCAAEGPLKKSKRGTPEDQERLQERRQRLQRRIRRRNRAARAPKQRRGARISLW